MPRRILAPRGVTGWELPAKLRGPVPFLSKRDSSMARKSRTAVLKRQREAKKAEKAAMKREKRDMRESQAGDMVATSDDLAGYGFGGDEDDEEPEAEEA